MPKKLPTSDLLCIHRRSLGYTFPRYKRSRRRRWRRWWCRARQALEPPTLLLLLLPKSNPEPDEGQTHGTLDMPGTPAPAMYPRAAVTRSSVKSTPRPCSFNKIANRYIKARYRGADAARREAESGVRLSDLEGGRWMGVRGAPSPARGPQ